MRVLLRNGQTGLYHDDAGAWVVEAAKALNFRTIQSAGKKAREYDWESLEVVLDYGNPKHELALNPAYCIQRSVTKGNTPQQPRP